MLRSLILWMSWTANSLVLWSCQVQKTPLYCISPHPQFSFSFFPYPSSPKILVPYKEWCPALFRVELSSISYSQSSGRLWISIQIIVCYSLELVWRRLVITLIYEHEHGYLEGSLRSSSVLRQVSECYNIYILHNCSCSFYKQQILGLDLESALDLVKRDFSLDKELNYSITVYKNKSKQTNKSPLY